MTDGSDELGGLAGLLESDALGVAVLDAQGIALWANGTLLRWLGADIVRDGGAIPALPQLAFADHGASIRSSIEAGTSLSIRSVPVRPPGGQTVRFLDIELHPIESLGRPRSALVVTDATDREEGRSRAALFYTSFLTSTNAIEVTDRAGVLVDVNPAFERIYGYTRAECVGRRPNLVRGRTAPPELYARMWADLLDPDRGHWSGELMNRDRHGRERPVFLTITAIRDETGTTTHYLGVAVDLKEQRVWERQAAHSDKLASLGQLAAGVAHEINTPLANVMLIAESIRRRTEDPWVRDRLDRISAQVDVAGTIVRGLLDFARRGEPQIRKLDLADVVRESLEFLRGKQSANIEFSTRWPPEPVSVWGDRGQLLQVFTNLLNNACEALAGSGHVVVEVRARGPDAEVEISDDGPGIPADAMPHLFEPFFTTKPEGQGTGLGLAVCAGIVQTHHGTITARNLPNRGASFTIVVPISRAEPPPPILRPGPGG
jgi:PAS domain S-box-containing protein